MRARLLLVLALALLPPSTAGAQGPRPSPAMVAAAMLPCVTNEGRIPVEVRATVVGAEFWEYPEPTMRWGEERVAYMHENVPKDQIERSRAVMYLDDDPSPFPLVLDVSPAWGVRLETDARFRYPECFRATYRP